MTETHDVLIVGSGHSGGMAAKILTSKGISCLMLNAGPEADYVNGRVPVAAHDLPYRGFGKPGRLTHVTQANEYNAEQWVDEKEVPYTSPADRQQLYRGGLDALNAKAKAKFSKSFAELDARQVDAVIRPLLAATPWAWDLRKDPVMRFIASVRTDVATATRNSPVWAEKAGTRGGGAGQLKWLPIDPIYKG